MYIAPPKTPTQGIGPVCNQFLGSRQTNVVLPDGRQVYSSWAFGDKAYANQVCIYGSDDGGTTFKTLAILNRSSETALALLDSTGADGTLYYNARHAIGGETNRVTGQSVDGGMTWQLVYNSTHSPPDTKTDSVPGPVLVTNRTNGQGSVLLISLPLGPGRSNIALSASVDNGNTWASPKQLDGGYGG